MKILIASQYFWPETFRINDLATELIQRGHEVFVLTGKPNYPQGKFFNGYGMFSHRRDEYNGAKVYRVPIIPRGKGKGLQLFLNYASFVFFSCIFILFNKIKFDVSITFAISPITQIYPALLHKKLYNSRAFLWVQDLWPESVIATNRLNSKCIIKYIDKLVKNIYRNSDIIFISSKYMKYSILEKTGSNKSSKILYLPNWAEDSIYKTNSSIDNKYSSLIPDGFIIMFAGNIGFAQDCPSIINTVNLLKMHKHIKFIFLGDGSERSFIKQKIDELGLEETVFLLGKYPSSEMPYFYVHADIMLLTLRDEDVYSFTVPSKLQSYLAYGKPIAGMVNGESANIIISSQSGIVTDAGNYHEFAKIIVKLSKTSKSSLVEMGNNGKKYYEKNFTKEMCIDNLENIIKNYRRENYE